MSCDADTVANDLLTSLLQGKTFTLPAVDLTTPQYQVPGGDGPIYGDINKLTVEELTTGQIDGNGVFDKLMAGINAHLKREYEQSRITGNQYTEAYIAAIGGALQTATSFLLGRDQAYWQALMLQQQARTAEIQVTTARVQLETAKAQLMTSYLQAQTSEAEFGLTKLKLASEDQSYCLLKAQTESAVYTNENILPNQKALLMEQIEVQRAQTVDRRTDGTTIFGSVGKQKDLYNQQIISYQRDAEVKAAKLWTDAWITMKTIDEGLLPPEEFKNNTLDVVLENVRRKNSLVAADI